MWALRFPEVLRLAHDAIVRSSFVCYSLDDWSGRVVFMTDTVYSCEARCALAPLLCDDAGCLFDTPCIINFQSQDSETDFGSSPGSSSSASRVFTCFVFFLHWLVLGD